jgi:hypothetical protein
MLLLAFGHAVLCFWAFRQATLKYEESGYWLSDKLRKSTRGSFAEFFARMAGLLLLKRSPFAEKKKALEILNENTRRHSLVHLCLSGLSAFIWWVLFYLLFKIAGAFLLFAGAIAHFSKKRFPYVASFFWFVFFTGLFVMSVELALRPGTFLTRSQDLQSIVFFLADNRWPAILGCIVLAGAATLLLRLEGWAWMAALLGVVMGIMSINVALAFVLGEGLGWQFLLWWESRRQAKVKKLTIEMLGVYILAMILFFSIYAYLRNQFVFFRFAGDLNNLLARLGDFLFVVPVWIAFQTIILLIWGHFRRQ